MKPQKVPSPPFLPGTRPCVLSQQHLGRCIRMQSVDGCWLSPALALMSGSWSPFPPHLVGRRLVHCWDPQRLPFRGSSLSLSGPPASALLEVPAPVFSLVSTLPSSRMCCY